MPTFTPQVREGHYVKSSYLTKDRWINYWYQWQWLQARGLKTLLEVGVGNGVVAELFEKTGIEVTTIDIDEALKPTKVASVTALPFSEDAFDGVLCAEVLEHLPFEESLQGIREIYRVTTTVGTDHAYARGLCFSLEENSQFSLWCSWYGRSRFWKNMSSKGALLGAGEKDGVKGAMDLRYSLLVLRFIECICMQMISALFFM